MCLVLLTDMYDGDIMLSDNFVFFFFPAAFQSMMTGGNIGKQIVCISGDTSL